LKYEVQRNSPTLSWPASKKQSKAEILAIRNTATGELRFKTYHTTPETEETNKKITSELKKTFNSNGLLKDTEVTTVLFGDFTNHQRVSFLLYFTGINEVNLKFDRQTDLDLKLDDRVPLPSECPLDWMKEKVRSLKLSGDAIHETFLVTDVSCHQFLLFRRMECRFVFENADFGGDFTAIFEFSSKGKTITYSSPFQIHIPRLNIRKTTNTPTLVKELSRKYLDRLNELIEPALINARRSGRPVAGDLPKPLTPKPSPPPPANHRR